MEVEIKSVNTEIKPKKKRMTRNSMKISYFAPLAKRMSVTENKIGKMMNTIEEELKRVEIEWLHLKGMRNHVESSIVEDVNVEPETNLDDANQINELKCDFGIGSNVPVKMSYSESEYEFSDHISDEDDCNI